MFRTFRRSVLRASGVCLAGTLLALSACTDEAPAEHSILVIGDSISLGQGAGGEGPNCNLSVETNRPDRAFGTRVALELGADLNVLALAGRGLVYNYNGAKLRTVQGWLQEDDYAILPNGKETPDVVFVHLGTNDFFKHDATEAFTPAYTELASTILERYPDAHLYALIGPMLDSEDRAVARDSIRAALEALPADQQDRATFYEFQSKDFIGLGIGCSWHPSAEMHDVMAQSLIKLIEREQ